MQRQVQQARIQTAQLRRMQRQVQQARVKTPKEDGDRRRATIRANRSPYSEGCQHQPPRTWRPRQDGYPRGMTAVSVEPKAAALEKTNEDIIDVYHGRDPSFSANGLSFLMEFHKDHLAVDLYGMTPENREIVELALKNDKAKRLLITCGSDSAIKAVYQANREARVRGMPGYRPEQGRLEAKAPFSRSDLEYLRRYFTVTLADTIFGLTTEERARVSRLDDYLTARDALAKARQSLEEEIEASDPPKIKASTDDTPGTARRQGRLHIGNLR
ncbi:unnamed protein product [Prunus armeniaca]